MEIEQWMLHVVAGTLCWSAHDGWIVNCSECLQKSNMKPVNAIVLVHSILNDIWIRFGLTNPNIVRSSRLVYQIYIFDVPEIYLNGVRNERNLNKTLIMQRDDVQPSSQNLFAFPHAISQQENIFNTTCCTQWRAKHYRHRATISSFWKSHFESLPVSYVNMNNGNSCCSVNY